MPDMQENRIKELQTGTWAGWKEEDLDFAHSEGNTNVARSMESTPVRWSLEGELARVVGVAVRALIRQSPEM
jgi:hypothetical protein